MLVLKTHLPKEQIELDGVIMIHILVREKELLPESQYGGLLINPLLHQALARVQPVHCMWRYGIIFSKCKAF